MTDNIKMPQALEPDLEDHEYELWGQNVKADFVTVENAIAYAREAVRLNAQAVPDAPTWEQVQKAWYAVGADVAGLDWSAFVRKVSAAPAAPQPVQAVPDGDAAEAVHDTNAVLASRYFELLKVVEAYEKHGVTCQTFRHFVDTPCAECNCAPAAPQPAQASIKAELLCVCGCEWQWENRSWELVSGPYPKPTMLMWQEAYQSVDDKLDELESLAKRLALDLECVLLNREKWWDQAHETLQAYRDLMECWYPQETVSPLGKD